MRHIPCKLLLAFATLLFTLPIYAAETRGVKRVEIKTAAGEAICRKGTLSIIHCGNQQY